MNVAGLATNGPDPNSKGTAHFETAEEETSMTKGGPSPLPSQRK